MIIDYNVDIVFCIDCTASMYPYVNRVKQNIFKLCNDLQTCMEKKHKHISQLRVRVVAFRDYVVDKEKAMMVTDFFKLPQEADEFEKCVRSLTAEGGGNNLKDGLEALAYAIKSKWDTGKMKKRQVIVVWTDAGTHPLGYGKKSSYYPKGMPKDIKELYDWWNNYFIQTYKRLLLFAPDVPYWNTISKNWENVLHYPSNAGEGICESDWQELVRVLVTNC